jgi:hypothetical protein
VSWNSSVTAVTGEGMDETQKELSVTLFPNRSVTAGVVTTVYDNLLHNECVLRVHNQDIPCRMLLSSAGEKTRNRQSTTVGYNSSPAVRPQVEQLQGWIWFIPFVTTE